MLNDYHLGFGNTLGFEALKTAYSKGEEWLGELLAYLEESINFIEDYLNKNLPGVKMIKPEGTYLVWLDFRALEMRPKELKDFLIHDAGLGLHDGPWFGPGGEGFQRMNVACPQSYLEKGLNQLKEAMERKGIG